MASTSAGNSGFTGPATISTAQSAGTFGVVIARQRLRGAAEAAGAVHVVDRGLAMALQETGALGAGAGYLDDAVGDRLLGSLADVGSLVAVLDMGSGHARHVVARRDFGVPLRVDHLKSDFG